MHTLVWPDFWIIWPLTCPWYFEDVPANWKWTFQVKAFYVKAFETYRITDGRCGPKSVNARVDLGCPRRGCRGGTRFHGRRETHVPVPHQIQLLTYDRPDIVTVSSVHQLDGQNQRNSVAESHKDLSWGGLSSSHILSISTQPSTGFSYAIIP